MQDTNYFRHCCPLYPSFQQFTLCPVDGSKATQTQQGKKIAGCEFLQMVSGEQVLLCPSFPKQADRSFQLSSIKFP